MSWSPPHSDPNGPPPPGQYGYGAPVPPPPGPYGYGAPVPPPTAPPPPPRKRRTGLVVLLVALPLALLIGAGVVIGTVLGGTKQLSDNQHRVTLTVPRTWTNDAGPDAGQRVEQGEDSYTIPDIDTGGMLADVAVFIEPRSPAPLSKTHSTTVNEECEYTGCIARGRPEATEVNGRRGLQQVLRHPEEEITAVLTVESETLVVTVLGHAIADDQQQVIDLLRTVVVSR